MKYANIPEANCFRDVFLLSFHNDAAGDFAACISSRLGMKVIRVTVNDHRFSNDVRHPEPICSDEHIGAAAAKKQGRQITGVVGMRRLGGVIVAPGFRKPCSGTAAPFVDMQTEKSAGITLGQIGDVDFHQYIPRLLIKTCDSSQLRGFRTAPDVSKGMGSGVEIIHKITHIQSMKGTEYG